jgi:3-mercaptopropionate dioxygenase
MNRLVASSNPDPLIRSFADEIHATVAEGNGEIAVTAEVATRLRALLASGLCLPTAVTRPGPDSYTMYPLYVAQDGSLSIAAAVWDVGEETPIHDHGTWGVIGVYAGAEREQRYALRADARSAPMCIETNILEAGEVKVCCTSDADVHAVSCASDVPCVAIHVYGADIGRIVRHTYDPLTGARGDFVSAWSVPVDG